MIVIASHTVDNPETVAVLALMARPEHSGKRLAGAIEERGSAVALLADAPGAQSELFGEAPPGVDLDAGRDRLREWQAEGMAVVTVLDDDYPMNLRSVYDRPAALFVRGELDERDERSVAVVGTRRATDAGLASAAAVTRCLVAAGYVIVSGLAAGIDTAAHQTALDAGARTIAVIGTGLRHAFPKANAALQRRLGEETAVISQFWPDQGPRKHTFPLRNAVMSGVARATVVIEASQTSGARMQARLALEHGRPVFLLAALLEHDWARDYRDRDGVYVVESPEQIAEHLERLYADQLSPAP